MDNNDQNQPDYTDSQPLATDASAAGEGSVAPAGEGSAAPAGEPASEQPPVASAIGAPQVEQPRVNPVVYELSLFFTALMFYTRLPGPSWVGYSDEMMNKSTRYFPVIGWVVGVVLAAVIGVSCVVLPPALAVGFGLAVGVMLTGAFHEDGFADVCDGFGGGMTRERTLDIMKDSRVGAFAVIGLVLLFGIKISAMTALVTVEPWYGLLAIVYAHVLSRFCVVTIIYTDDYARNDATSKIRPVGNNISTGGLVVSGLWLLPFVALMVARPLWLVTVPVALLIRWRMGGWFKKRLGGYTGDCLGAAQQVIEVFTFVTILVSIAIMTMLGFSSTPLWTVLVNI